MRQIRAAAPPAVSIVVPCHNEEENLSQLYSRLTETCQAVCRDWEIILVDDGSSDSTWSLIVALASSDHHVVGVNLSRNYGHQIAVTSGLDRAMGDRVMIIDADLQDPPELLARMMRIMDEEAADVVYGKRVSRDDETLTKRLTAAVFYRVLRQMSGLAFPVDTGDFRLISRRVVETLREMPEQQRYLRGMVGWIGFKQVPLEYERAPRHAGRTSYNYARMIRFAVDAFTSFTIAPLRLASACGLLCAILSVPLIGYTIVHWIKGDVVAGWTSLMSAILFFGSLQMMMLGIMGEYIGRLMIEAKRRPLYIVQNEINRSRVPGERESRVA